MDDLRLARLVVEQAIEQALEFAWRPRVHPNGFIKLDLPFFGSRHQLHVWPSIDRQVEAQTVRTSIHDHKFDMSSTVLRGGLRQVLHDVTLSHTGDPSHEIYVARRIGDTADTQLEASGVDVWVEPTPRIQPVQAGETYFQPAFTFHDTMILGWPTVTLMTRDRVYDESNCGRVLVPKGVEPDNEFRREQEDPGLLWDIVKEAVAW